MAQLMLDIDKEKYRNSNVTNVFGGVNYLNMKDKRMRFNNAEDPIYFLFDVLENRSIPALFNDFVEDSCYEVTKLIKKVIK